ncbi:hypothetical protein GOP47_0000196 [Adiantum capillus-veneris]|uniref:Uncharacterized protein n=1 Tax=Adiantum capillus-veneris TaxID=13818 RepID=A0A9D4VEP5_ADICA|nr:hypothetical protein GOP47_0000196 [Adiantum capillus-veneris]
MAMYYDTALLHFQFALACWHIIQLTPVGFLMKALFLWLETFCAKLVGIYVDTGYCIQGFSYNFPLVIKGAINEEEVAAHTTVVTLEDSFDEDVQQDCRDDVVNLSAEGVLVERTLLWHNHSCLFRLEKKKVQASQFVGTAGPAEPTGTRAACSDDVELQLQLQDDFDLFLTAKIDWQAPVKYYITDEKFWHRVIFIFSNNLLLLVKSKKNFFWVVDTAEVMSPMEVLDKVLLEYRYLKRCRRWVLPVRSPEEELKVLASMTLAGLYAQVKGYSKLAIGILTLLTTLLQFSHRLRWWVYDHISATLALPVQCVVDRLPGLRTRQLIYDSMSTYWKRLPPCNDCQARVLRLKSGARFYSLYNVKCNDLRLLGRLPMRNLDAEYDTGADIKESENFVSRIKWGGYIAEMCIPSPQVNESRALLRYIYAFQSGAVRSKEGSRVKVWRTGHTLRSLHQATTVKLNQWEAVGPVTIK